MRRQLYRFYWWLERRLFPNLRFSQTRYYELLKGNIPQGCKWVDLGCGHQMFAEWMTAEQNEMAARAEQLVGVDLDWEGLRRNPFVHHKIYGNLEALPFPNGSFDVVTANMVVEHLDHPAQVLTEVKRLLRPNGKFFFHTPNSKCVMMRIATRLPQRVKNLLALVLEGREEADVFPTRYRMNTRADIERLAAEAGLEVERIQVFSSSAVTALLGPVAIVELLYMRWIERPGFEDLRSNLMVILRQSGGKPA